MAINENELSFIRSIIDPDGALTIQSRTYFLALDDAINLSIVAKGSGSPEGVLTAEPNKFYRDTAGPNLYWKSTGSGNTGWLLVV